MLKWKKGYTYSFSIRQFVRLYSAVEKIQGLQVFVVGLNIIYDPLVFEGEGGCY